MSEEKILATARATMEYATGLNNSKIDAKSFNVDTIKKLMTKSPHDLLSAIKTANIDNETVQLIQKRDVRDAASILQLLQLGLSNETVRNVLETFTDKDALKNLLKNHLSCLLLLHEVTSKNRVPSFELLQQCIKTLPPKYHQAIQTKPKTLLDALQTVISSSESDSGLLSSSEPDSGLLSSSELDSDMSSSSDDSES